MDRITKVLAGIPDEQNVDPYTDTKGKEGFRNPVRPAVGEGLTELVARLKLRKGVELGTALGRSGLHMALGGLEQLATVEFDSDAAEQARDHFAAAGLPKFVVHNMDSEEFTRQWHHPIDLLFIDHAKDRYLGDLQALEAYLTPNALVLLDNAYNRADALQECAAYVAGNYHAAIFMEPPTGKDGVTTGLLVASKDRATFDIAMQTLENVRGGPGNA